MTPKTPEEEKLIPCWFGTVPENLLQKASVKLAKNGEKKREAIIRMLQWYVKEG